MTAINYATNNRAVNRATCSLFIERSLAGIAHPCLRCPQSRVLQDPDCLGYFNVCPCGREEIDIYERNPLS